MHARPNTIKPLIDSLDVLGVPVQLLAEPGAPGELAAFHILALLAVRLETDAGRGSVPTVRPAGVCATVPRPSA